MAKKTMKEDVKPEAVVENGSKNLEKKTGEQKTPKFSVPTSDGKVLDKPRFYPSGDIYMVQAEYGKLDPAGKTAEERRAGMVMLMSRALTPEQTKEFLRLNVEDPAKAKDYAVRAAYPMHVDADAFHQKEATVNGKSVNYIVLEKVTEDALVLDSLRKNGADLSTPEKTKAALEGVTADQRAKILEGKDYLVGKWRLSFGNTNEKGSHFVDYLNSEELAMVKNRAHVVMENKPIKNKDGSPSLDENGKQRTREVITSVGTPVSMADIAAHMQLRVAPKHEAKNIDWSQYQLPKDVTLKGLRYADDKRYPDQLWVNAKVGVLSVSGLLTKVETAALRNKYATLEQVAAANKNFTAKLQSVIGQSTDKGVTVTLKDASDAVVARASDSSARSFTSEQAGIITRYLGDVDGDGRMDVAEEIWGKAKEELDGKKIDGKWQEDAHQELKDLAMGKVRDNQASLHR